MADLLAQMAYEARKLGFVISSDSLKKAEEANDEFTKIGKSFQAAGISISAGFLPALKELRAVVTSQDFQDGVKTLAENFASLIRWMVDNKSTILTVAGELRSDFERLAHEPAARQAGLSQEQLNEVLAGRIPGGLTEDEALICRLAHVMTAHRNLPDEDYDQGLTALGQERLATLTWLVGYYSALALALAVFRPEVPEPMWAAYRAATG